MKKFPIRQRSELTWKSSAFGHPATTRIRLTVSLAFILICVKTWSLGDSIQTAIQEDVQDS